MIVKEYVNQPGKKISYKLDFDISNTKRQRQV